MRLSIEGLEDYLGCVVELLERYGVVLDLDPTDPLALEESPSGALSFSLRGFMPDGRTPPLSVLGVRERWHPVGSGEVERREYEYELIDHERGFRRGFHRHDTEFFIRRFDVVVHEHCKSPIGTAPCAHIEGSPVRDAYRGVEVLLETWVDPAAPDCAAMRCL